MATLAKLTVKLVTDVNEFTKGMDTAVNKMAKVGKSMQQVGDKMTKNVTLPILAIGTASIKLASDLQETRNKASVVFGSMSDDILAWGKTSLDTVFLSEQHALDYASTFGAIVKNMGLSEKEALDMSKTLVQATVDLASMSNLSYGESFEKMRAGMVGSSEPLLSLGKDLRVANIEAYAFSNNIAKAGETLDNRQLTLARFGSLMSQMTDETGDAARTIGDLAGQSRLLSETFQSTLATFGELLVPVTIKFMQAVIPILEWFGKLPEPVKMAIVNIALFTAALGPLMSGGGRLLQLGKGLQGLLGKAGLTSLMAKLSGAAAGAGGSLAGVGSGLLAALGPALLLAASIGVLVVVLKTMGPAAWESVKMIGVIADAVFKRLAYEVKRLPIELGKMIGNAIKTLRSRISDFVNSGRYLMGGFIDGVISMGTKLIKSVVTPVMMAVNAIHTYSEMASNSKLTKRMGMYFVGGFTEGITKGTPAVAKAGAGIAKSGTNGLASGISGSGRGRGVENYFNINIAGALSEEEKVKLRKEIRNIFGEEIEAAYGVS
jgi:hypothetical protein